MSKYRTTNKDQLRKLLTMQNNQFLTVKQVAEKYPWPSEQGLRHLIFYADENGFSRCIRRIGRRVLIKEEEFLSWLNESK